MANFEQYNSTNYERIEWGFDMSEIPFVKRDEMIKNHVYKTRALYISANHGYGVGAVAVIDNVRVNLPAHAVEKVKEIINGEEHEENIRAIKAGELGVEFYEYDTQTRKKCIGIRFKNIKQGA